MRAKYIDSTESFNLTLNAYCGMPIPIIEGGDKEDCRKAAARRIRFLRADGFPVATLEPGQAWEVQEPEDCCLVPDSCGVLRMSPVQVRVFECWECGSDIREGESCDCQEPWEDTVDCGCQYPCMCHLEEQEEEEEAI
jgi:hypothetical protein